MPGKPKTTTVTIIPSLRYSDAPAAIDWLCNAFGFEQQLVVPGDDGDIAHAQLTFGNGMIMLGSERDVQGDPVERSPNVDASSAHARYVIVEDADDHCAGAKAAGADIVMEPEDQPYGGRLYACRDLEGNPWYFGTYDPWQDN